MRRTLLVLGLAAAGVGGWLFEQAHAAVNGCALAPVSRGGLGADPGCATQVWVGYAGFGLFVAGLMVSALALVVLRRRRADLSVGAPRARSLVGTPGEGRGHTERADPLVVRPLRAEPAATHGDESRPPSAA